MCLHNSAKGAESTKTLFLSSLPGGSTGGGATLLSMNAIFVNCKCICGVL